MLTTWLAGNVSRFVKLASLPFDRTVHERYFASIGWTVTREAWYPETCFEIPFSDVGRRLVAVYENAETGLGIGLYALTGSRGTRDYYVATKPEFDHAFHSTFGEMAPVLHNQATTGIYSDQNTDHPYNYAYWEFPNTFLVIVQHFEGDRQCGHEASLDIRVLPRLANKRLVFPLITNILF